MHKIVGMMRVRDEIRWIESSIRSIQSLCSTVYVLDDGSQDGTYELLEKMDNVVVFRSPYHDLNEARDKDFLLRTIIEENDHYGQPDWIIAIDGDEELEAAGESKVRHFLSRHGHENTVSAFGFHVRYLWDTADNIRVDGVYENFYRPSMFRLAGEPISRLHYNQTDGKHNLHCSNFPQGLRGGILNVGVRLKHYGYMFEADRKRKYEYYNRIDPGNITEDEYKHILGLPSRHAPGKIRFEKWED